MGTRKVEKSGTIENVNGGKQWLWILEVTVAGKGSPLRCLLLQLLLLVLMLVLVLVMILRKETAGGAWCPRSQIERGIREWLQVDLPGAHVITGVQTQGRYDHGRGQEYVEEYTLEYRRPTFSEWRRYKRSNNQEVFPGNSDTSTVVSHNLVPPIFANQIRILPHSVHRRTVCLRIELRGCQDTNGNEYDATDGDTGANADVVEVVVVVYSGGDSDDGGGCAGAAAARVPIRKLRLQCWIPLASVTALYELARWSDSSYICFRPSSDVHTNPTTTLRFITCTCLMESMRGHCILTGRDITNT
ncbi:hypothetical protein HZH68_011426 [Vespula germanica]|uniref:F5/8 type C domain-containing protein n=1 Tax=Vespula germanica TaxID=30212 RepID=A0A834JNH9_VESGE|nr:hypothetical protein HZH68_011426 [Vespula germanica]